MYHGRCCTDQLLLSVPQHPHNHPFSGTTRTSDALRAGGDWTDAAAATGDCAVGTTRLDASKWGLGRVVLAIGPERGWTDSELHVLTSQGFSTVGLGRRTLSSSTAVLSALAVCQEALR